MKRAYGNRRFNLGGTFATEMAAGTLVRISANETFAAASGANTHHVVGVVVTPRDGNNRGVVELRAYQELWEECVAYENVTAGQFAKQVDLIGGEPQFGIWADGDLIHQRLGVYFQGATAGNKAKILIF